MRRRQGDKSNQEEEKAIISVNDSDSFTSVEPDEPRNALSDIGLDTFDFELMEDDEKAGAPEEAGLDPNDFDF